MYLNCVYVPGQPRSVLRRARIDGNLLALLILRLVERKDMQHGGNDDEDRCLADKAARAGAVGEGKGKSGRRLNCEDTGRRRKEDEPTDSG